MDHQKLLQAVDRVISSLNTQVTDIVDDRPDHVLHADQNGVDELLTGAAAVINGCNQEDSGNLAKHGIFFKYPAGCLSEQEKEEPALLIIERPSHTVSILGSLGQVHIYHRF